MLKHVKVPDSLFEMQRWFGKMIAQPLSPTSTLPAISPFETDAKEEAEKFIAPSLTLLPYQRIEIYHQQYWWRLLNCLHDNVPFVTRLFGFESFNKQIGIPFLSRMPSKHWALFRLGFELPEWIKQEYHEKDKDLVLQAAEIDVAALSSFWIKNLKSVHFEKLSQEEILEKKICLQPQVFLFSLTADFFSLREKFLEKEVSHWNSHPFPELVPRNCYFVLYRSLSNTVKWKELTFAEYKMLSYFKEGISINEAIERIENEAFEDASENLSLWFHEWTYLNWFGEG